MKLMKLWTEDQRELSQSQNSRRKSLNSQIKSIRSDNFSLRCSVEKTIRDLFLPAPCVVMLYILLLTKDLTRTERTDDRTESIWHLDSSARFAMAAVRTRRTRTYNERHWTKTCKCPSCDSCLSPHLK